MTTELTEIETEEVSLVTRGANRKRFAFHKQEKPMSLKFTAEEKTQLLKAFAACNPAALAKKFTEAKLAKGLADMGEAARAKAIQAIKLLASIGSELPEGLMEDFIEALGVESTSDLLAAMEGGSGAAAEDPGTVAAEDVPTTEEPMATEKQTEVKKTVEIPEAVRAQITKAEKSAADAQAKLVELQKKADADRVELEKKLGVERDARLTREFIAKAEKSMSHLPTTAAELAPILKELSEKAPDAYAKLEKVLEGASEKAKTTAQLLKELGRGGQGDGNADTAMAKLTKIAAELKKADPKLTDAAAMTRALSANPALYEQYETERKAGEA